MKKNFNCGVHCNVHECKYNENGCKCNKIVIDVSHGDAPMSNGVAPHYCKSFCEKGD